MKSENRSSRELRLSSATGEIRERESGVLPRYLICPELFRVPSSRVSLMEKFGQDLAPAPELSILRLCNIRPVAVASTGLKPSTTLDKILTKQLVITVHDRG